MNTKFKNILIAIGLAACLIPSSVQAFPWKFNQPKKVTPQPTPSKNTSFVSLFEPVENSSPAQTIGGAVRSSGSCFQHLESKNKMAALVPNVEQSTTTKSHPEFFAYIPPMDDNKNAMLVVRDVNEDYYYTQEVAIPAEGGIVKIDLAQDAPELEIGKKYNWFLQVHCAGTPKIDDPILEAQVTRVNLANAQSPISQEESVNFFTQNQIWYDSLASAHDLIENNSTYWQELISSIGMEQLSTETVVSFESIPESN